MRRADLEKAWTELLGPSRITRMDGRRATGVNSRLDTWQRFTEGKVTPQAIDRYFAAVGTALGEAPLDRPGERLLLPEDYQALRDSQVSGELLRGLAQGLVLLAAFGGPHESAACGSSCFRTGGASGVHRARGHDGRSPASPAHGHASACGSRSGGVPGGDGSRPATDELRSKGTPELSSREMVGRCPLG